MDLHVFFFGQTLATREFLSSTKFGPDEAAKFSLLEYEVLSRKDKKLCLGLYRISHKNLLDAPPLTYMEIDIPANLLVLKVCLFDDKIAATTVGGTLAQCTNEVIYSDKLQWYDTFNVIGQPVHNKISPDDFATYLLTQYSFDKR